MYLRSFLPQTTSLAFRTELMSTTMQQSSAMMSISQSIINGGVFTHHDHRQIQVYDAQASFSRLQDVVAHGAFHNSGDRFDPPRCHPNTRVAVIRKIMDWILRQDMDTRNAYIVWLHGAAGAGKSAIAQSIAELCYAEGRLAASFFFARSDPSRNHVRSFFATLAYQIALSITPFRQKLDAVIEHDPLIFTRSPSDQFLSLIIEPFRDLSQSNIFVDANSSWLVVIDGLDECLDRKMQRRILDVIIRGIRDFRLPLLFLISCRPEIDISTRFNSPDTNGILIRLLLDHSYLPDHDIEVFLRDKFKEISETHPFNRSIPNIWPSEETIRHLIRKSSGQFIYASTVIKYIESNRHQPHRRLEATLDLRPTRGDQPFTELDALYTHIFSSVIAIDEVFSIIAFHLLGRASFIKSIEQFLSLEDGEIAVFFCDLSSVIALRQEGTGIYFRILHASLPDFLLDKSRSGKFHIDMELHCALLIRRCLWFLGYKPLTDSSTYATHRLAMNFFVNHCNDCINGPDVWIDASSFPLLQVYTEALSFARRSQADSFVIRDFNYSFLPPFFAFIRRMSTKYSDGEVVYKRHQSAFDQLLKTHLMVYYKDVHLSFLATLVDFFVNNDSYEPYGFIQDPVLFGMYSHLRQLDYLALTLLSHDSLKDQAYYRLIHEFLIDKERSGSLGLDEGKYANSAEFCLEHLWTDHPPTGNTTVLDPHVACLVYFLDRAGRSVKLIELCQIRQVHLESVEPSMRFARVREALARYLNKMNVT